MRKRESRNVLRNLQYDPLFCANRTLLPEQLCSPATASAPPNNRLGFLEYRKKAEVLL